MSGHCIFAGVLLELVGSVLYPFADALGYFLDRLRDFAHFSIGRTLSAQPVVIGTDTSFSYLATLQFIHLARH